MMFVSSRESICNGENKLKGRKGYAKDKKLFTAFRSRCRPKLVIQCQQRAKLQTSGEKLNVLCMISGMLPREDRLTLVRSFNNNMQFLYSAFPGRS